MINASRVYEFFRSISDASGCHAAFIASVYKREVFMKSRTEDGFCKLHRPPAKTVRDADIAQ